MPQLKPGTRLRSAVCETEVMVIQAPAEEVELTCGGAPMIPHDAEPPPGAALDESAAGGTALGKRYVNAAGTLEVLCTRPGRGSLRCGEETLEVKGAKPLPASD